MRHLPAQPRNSSRDECSGLNTEGVRDSDEAANGRLSQTPFQERGICAVKVRAFGEFLLRHAAVCSRCSQDGESVTRAESETGRRYQQHVAMGSNVMLFARRPQR